MLLLLLPWCTGAAAGYLPVSPGASGAAGTPRTPGAGAPATPAVAAAAAQLANQAPGQVAAALHAQGKTYDDLVHMYADMVSSVPAVPALAQWLLAAGCRPDHLAGWFSPSHSWCCRVAAPGAIRRSLSSLVRQSAMCKCFYASVCRSDA